MTRQGENFEFDQQNWTNYSNFKLACDNIAMEMINIAIAVELEVAVWKDERGLDCAEKLFCGFQATHDVGHPTYFLIVDEVRGNVSQKGDGCRGGIQFMHERGLVPKKVTSNTHGHLTLLVFSSTNGDLVTCCMILCSVI